MNRGVRFAGWIAGFLLLSAAAWAQAPDKATLAALNLPQVLPDMWIGRDDAPVTLIEYASLNCRHCADFEQKVLPELKAKYIDTGKLRFVMRDIPINTPSINAAKLARCAGLRRAEAIDLFEARLREWGDEDTPQKLVALVTGAKLLTRAAADACLKDPRLTDAIQRQIAIEAPLKFGLVPVFFVNGTRYESELPADAIAKLVPAAATAPPPPVQAQAQSPRNPFQLLLSCDLVASHDAAAAPRVKAADDQLVALALANLQLDNAYRGFLAACPALKGPDPSPAMDRFRTRSYEVGIFRARVTDQAAALRSLLKTEPLASLSRRGSANEADYCAFSLATIGNRLLTEADTLNKRAQIDCTPAGKP